MNHALVVIFNQDYSANIGKLEHLYGKRFSRRFYLVPCHHSTLDRYYRNRRLPFSWIRAVDWLIGRLRRLLGRAGPHALSWEERRQMAAAILEVVGFQIYFQDFIAQAARRLLAEDIQWYWFIGDDALLDPLLSEENILDQFGVIDHDAVMCAPVKGTDPWLERIGGGAGQIETGLRAAGILPRPDVLGTIPKEQAAQGNDTVVVACCDFVGVRRDLLDRLWRPLGRSARRRLYVETAVPNAVLTYARKVLSFREFSWQREPLGWGEAVRRFDAADTGAFLHPVKLSGVTLDEIRHTQWGRPSDTLVRE